MTAAYNCPSSDHRSAAIDGGSAVNCGSPVNDTVVVDSLTALDPKRPIREADMSGVKIKRRCQPLSCPAYASECSGGGGCDPRADVVGVARTITLSYPAGGWAARLHDRWSQGQASAGSGLHAAYFTCRHDQSRHSAAHRASEFANLSLALGSSPLELKL